LILRANSKSGCPSRQSDAKGKVQMKKLTSFIATIAVLLTVAFAAARPALSKATSAVPAVTAASVAEPAATPAPDPQRHPEIRQALAALRTARAHIHDAAHDYNGHREEALRAVDSAIHQLEVCMQYDR
jgi:hypothetical protein